jgi:hypothetical protein
MANAAFLGRGFSTAPMVPEDFYSQFVTPSDGLGIQQIHALDAAEKARARQAAAASLDALIRSTGAAGRGVPNAIVATPQYASPPAGTMITRNAPVREPLFVAPLPPEAAAPTAPEAAPALPEFQGPPAPATPMETSIDPGIAIPADPQVTATDLPPLPAEGPNAMGVMSLLRNFRPSSRPVPLAAPPSRRFSSTRPQFIYTNPAAAQQAAANYQAQLSYEAAQDQGYRDYMARLNADDALNQRTQAQSQLYGSQIDAAAREGAAQRASNERITGMAEAARANALAQRDIAEARNRFLVAKSAADQLNRDPNARVNRNFVAIDANGRYIPAFPDPDQMQVPVPQAPPRAAVAVPQ